MFRNPHILASAKFCDPEGIEERERRRHIAEARRCLNDGDSKDDGASAREAARTEREKRDADLRIERETQVKLARYKTGEAREAAAKASAVRVTEVAEEIRQRQLEEQIEAQKQRERDDGKKKYEQLAIQGRKREHLRKLEKKLRFELSRSASSSGSGRNRLLQMKRQRTSAKFLKYWRKQKDYRSR